MKKCKWCFEIKPLSSFHKHKDMSDGVINQCRSCRNSWVRQYRKKLKESGLSANAIRCVSSIKKKEMSLRYRQKNPEKKKLSSKKWALKNRNKLVFNCAKRRANKFIATPKWVDFDLVKDMYQEAVYFNSHVDHIVPLNSDKVCGLHWEGNLQLLSMKENTTKSNKYWPDMWNYA